MKYFLTIFVLFFSAFIFWQVSEVKAQTGYEEGIYCEDPNDPDTCYSDPDYDLKQILQEGEALSNEPTAQEQAEVQKNISFEIKKVSGDLNPLNITGPEDIFSRAINALMAFIGSIALILYIYSGFIWMSAGGNMDKVSKAKSILIWTTLGAVAMGASYMIVRVILENVG